MRLVLLALIIFVLVSCGGGDDAAGTVEGPIGYVALGDSLAFGIGGSPGYVERYADLLRSDLGAEVRPVLNLGIPGWTSGELAAALRADNTMRAAVSSARALVWDIGGNDLRAARAVYLQGTCGGPDNLDCFRATLAAFKTNWDSILREIVALRSPSSTLLRTMDIYNPYVAVDPPVATAAMQPFLNEANAYIRSTAAANGIRVAGVFQAFNGADGTLDPVARGLISNDSLHPNNDGYALIADELRKLGYTPLQ